MSIALVIFSLSDDDDDDGDCGFCCGRGTGEGGGAVRVSFGKKVSMFCGESD